MTSEFGANKLGEIGTQTNELIAKLGLDRTAAILSEGYCPICETRSADFKVVDDEEEARPTTSATVECATCRTRWRTGINPDNNRDWIEHARSTGGMTLTFTINPPPDDDDDDWDDNDDWGHLP